LIFKHFQILIIWVVFRGIVNGAYRAEGVVAEDTMHQMDM